MSPDQSLRMEAPRGSRFQETLVRDTALLVDNRWFFRFSKVVLVHGPVGPETRPFVKIITPSDYRITALNEAGPRALHTDFQDGIGVTWLRVEPWITSVNIGGKYSLGLSSDFTREGTKLDLDVRSENPSIGHLVIPGIGTGHLKSALRSLITG